MLFEGEKKAITEVSEAVLKVESYEGKSDPISCSFRFFLSVAPRKGFQSFSSPSSPKRGKKWALTTELSIYLPAATCTHQRGQGQPQPPLPNSCTIDVKQSSSPTKPERTRDPAAQSTQEDTDRNLKGKAQWAASISLPPIFLLLPLWVVLYSSHCPWKDAEGTLAQAALNYPQIWAEIISVIIEEC